VAERAGHAMHTALVSRLLKDRSAWELAHVPVDDAAMRPAPAQASGELRSPALVGA
jgi:UDP-3-O-[3-hydroxymyristoyl] N-acetylglucosamine deacetylase